MCCPRAAREGGIQGYRADERDARACADHDIDANYGGNQITIYTGRGLLIESRAGNIWLYGTGTHI